MRVLSLKRAFLIAAAALAAGCGGGGGSDSTPASAPAPTVLAVWDTPAATWDNVIWQ